MRFCVPIIKKKRMHTRTAYITLSLLLALVFLMGLRFTINTEWETQQKLSFKGTAAGEQPVQILEDPGSSYVYWLDSRGGMHRHDSRTQRSLSFASADSAWRDVTLVEAFCLGKRGDHIYFTDLMDMKSGMSALKVCDTTGRNLQVLSYFSREIPYQLEQRDNLLFFLTEKHKGRSTEFRLGYVQVQDGRGGTLFTSDKKIESLELYTSDSLRVLDETDSSLITLSTRIEQLQMVAQQLP
jgi:hypothetical protein